MTGKESVLRMIEIYSLIQNNLTTNLNKTILLNLLTQLAGELNTDGSDATASIHIYCIPILTDSIKTNKNYAVTIRQDTEVN